jgi:hypothetical protein
MKSVTERLADKFGGTWEYDRKRGKWLCSDGREVGAQYHGARRYWMFEPSGNYYRITL